MFSGFMVDASNIMKFEAAQNFDSSAKYSVEWWIFKPSMDNKQVKHLFMQLWVNTIMFTTMWSYDV